MTISIAVDAMGGDFGPPVTVPASVQALSFYPSLKIILVGDEKKIKAELKSLSFSDFSRMSIVHCLGVVPNDMPPSKALRSCHGSSMRTAIEFVEEKKADACISAGNTGALILLSRAVLKLLNGVTRAALVSEVPTFHGKPTWLLDLGANVSADANTLFQFGLMGSVLAEQQLGRVPKVALLNVGEEEIKGHEAVRRCAEWMQQSNLVEFIGYVEGDQLFNSEADVIVCDGFVGNVCIKNSEGVARQFFDILKKHVQGSKLKTFISYWLFRSLYKQLKILKPDQYNGASLLGLRGIVVKSHGRADVSAFQHAIGEAVHEVERQLPKKISDRLEAVLLERHC